MYYTVHVHVSKDQKWLGPLNHNGFVRVWFHLGDHLAGFSHTDGTPARIGENGSDDDTISMDSSCYIPPKPLLNVLAT